MKNIIAALLIALAAFGAFAQMVGPNPFTPAGPQVTPVGGTGLVFDAPLTTSIVPRRGGPATFTRASTATVIDHEGIIRYVKSGEARFQGARRVENMLPSSDFSAGVPVKLDGGDRNAVQQHAHRDDERRAYTESCLACPVKGTTVSYTVEADAGTVSTMALLLYDTTAAAVKVQQSITLSGRKRYNLTYSSWVAGNSLAAYIYVKDTGTAANGDSIKIYNAMVEDITGRTNQSPSEYVSVGVLSSPYHGANVDGVKYFDTLNANTVSGNVVTDSVGTSLQSITNFTGYSETYGQTGWGQVGGTHTANAGQAPDGSNNAAQVSWSANGTYGAYTPALVAISDGAKLYTASVFHKVTAGTGVRLMLGSDSLGSAAFITISAHDGSYISAGGANVVSYGTKDVGGGWLRSWVTFKFNATGAGALIVYPVATAGAGSVLLWGAQCTETNAIAPYFQVTTQRIIENYLLGYVSESGRTNLARRSAELDNASWGKTATTVAADTVPSPDGSTSADTISETASTAVHFALQNITIVSGSTYTWSIFLKAGTSTAAQIFFDDGSNGPHLTVNLANGTITETGAHGTGTYIGSTITAFPVGWYRLTLTGIAGTGTAGRFGIITVNSTTPGWAPSFAGNTANNFYWWGAQVEQSSGYSSYIPTTSAAVTRNGDDIVYPVSLSSPGTIYAEATWTGTPTDTARGAFSLNDGSGNNRADIRTGGGVASIVSSGGVTQSSVGAGTGFVVGTPAKIAATWGINNNNVAKDGAIGVADTSAALPAPLNTLRVGDLDIGGFALFGAVRALKVYRKRLPDAALQQMTQ